MRELELPDVQDVMLEYRKIKLLYRSALKEIGTKLEILMMSSGWYISTIQLNTLNQDLRQMKVSLAN